MKYIINISLMLVATLMLSVSCQDKDDATTGFGPKIEELIFSAEGGVQAVDVMASKRWIASTDASWIMVSPSNGTSATKCKIIVDSTVLNSSRDAKISFTSDGQIKTINVNQMGFGKEIVIMGDQKTIELPDYGAYGKTFFEVKVLSNVKFKIDVPESETWLRYDTYTQDLSNLAKPRVVTIRFNWDINARPTEKKALVKFLPDEAVEGVKTDELLVVQQAAPEITDDRRGDSLALLAIARGLNSTMASWNPSQSMLYWEGVELDDDGRVYKLYISMLDTKLSLPYEIQYLTRLEELVVTGNANSQFRTIDLGDEVSMLTNLKQLSIVAYGLVSLPQSLKKLEKLELLSLSNNNFATLPLDVVNPTNFPNLRHLNFGGNRRREIYDLSNNTIADIGLGGELPRELFEWDSLKTLRLSYNYFEGSIPDMEDYAKRYEEKDGHPELEGSPKVFPIMEELYINLNRFTGDIPNWILKHPNLCDWMPYIMVFNQEGKNSQGILAKFNNVPDDITCASKPTATYVEQQNKLFIEQLKAERKGRTRTR